MDNVGESGNSLRNSKSDIAPDDVDWNPNPVSNVTDRRIGPEEISLREDVSGSVN